MKRSLVGLSVKVFSVVASIVLVVAFLVGFAGRGFAPAANASTSTSTTQTINLTVNEVITLSLLGANLNLPALTPGTPVTATTSATVTTNASAGWQLDIARNSATSTIASGTITFPDQTPFTGANATTSANLQNGGKVLAFRAYQTGTSAGVYNTSTWGTDDTVPQCPLGRYPDIHRCHGKYEQLYRRRADHCVRCSSRCAGHPGCHHLYRNHHRHGDCVAVGLCG